MEIKLKSDVLITTGTGLYPIDLVSRTTQARTGLTEDEAAVAVLLTERATDDDALLPLVRQHGVNWDLPTLHAFLEKLERHGFVDHESSPALNPTVLLVGESAAGTERPRFQVSAAPACSSNARVASVPLGGAHPETSIRCRRRASRLRHTGSIVAVLALVRQGNHAQAEAILKPILEADPDNAQATALLQLVHGAAQTRRRKRRTRIFGSLVGATVIATAASVCLFPVPDETTLSCTAVRIEKDRVKARISGLVKRVSVEKGEIVADKQALLVIADEASAGRLTELREQLGSDVELLEIMRSGGSDEAERTQLRRLKKLKREIRALGVCEEADDETCRKTREKLLTRVKAAKTKLRFCEWRAFPREIDALAKKVVELREQVDALKARPKQLEIQSSAAGLVIEIKNPGETVAIGDEVTRLVEARRFEVTAKLKGANVRKGTLVRVTIGEKGWVQTFAGRTRGQRGSNTLLIDVPTDVSKAQLSGVCTITLKMGKVFLAKKLLRLLKQ